MICYIQIENGNLLFILPLFPFEMNRNNVESKMEYTQQGIDTQLTNSVWYSKRKYQRILSIFRKIKNGKIIRTGKSLFQKTKISTAQANRTKTQSNGTKTNFIYNFEWV